MFMKLLDRLETFIVLPTGRSHAIYDNSVSCDITVFSYLFETVVASSHGISQCSVSRSIATVTDVLCDCAKDFIGFQM